MSGCNFLLANKKNRLCQIFFASPLNIFGIAWFNMKIESITIMIACKTNFGDMDTNAHSTYLPNSTVKSTRNQVESGNLSQESSFRSLNKKGQDGANENTKKVWLSSVLQNPFKNLYRNNHIGEDARELTEENGYWNGGTRSTDMEDETKPGNNKLIRIMESLDPSYRTPFLMAYQGRSYKEIQVALGGIPMEIVKSRIFQAREILKKQIIDMHA